MTPDEFALVHPRLFHITRASALPGIKRCGLLTTAQLLERFVADADARNALDGQRRAANLSLTHPVHGSVVITDNAPLHLRSLAACLDDGLTPHDWVRLLNRRVFFWTSEENLSRHLSAHRRASDRPTVLVFDTRSLAYAHAARMELTAINTGAALRKPARRGLTTFTPLTRYSYAEWRRLRGRRDRVKEVTVVDGVPDAMAHLVEVRTAETPGPIG
jgi:hypothetical protein